MPRAHPLRVACVQYDPKLGEVGANAARVRELTRRLGPGDLDLLVLPEMALTGYAFKSASEIRPFLEPQRGATYDLGAELARRLGCYVVAGYPERIPPSAAELAPEGHALPPSSPRSAEADASTEQPPGFDTIVTSAPAPQLAIPPPSGSGSEPADAPPSFEEATQEAKGVGYNSALVIDRAGALVGNYRKSFLYDADRPWCVPGPGFRYFDLAPPLGRTVVGICMDLNPKDFLAPWNAYELSGFARACAADTLVVPMNWLEPDAADSDSELDEDERAELAQSAGPNHPCLSNLNYWAARCAPLHDPTPTYATNDPTGAEGVGKEVVFVAANRSGTERGTTFSGSSAVLRLKPGGVELLEALSRGAEKALVAHVL